MRYAKGVCWIGDCRIPFVDETDFGKSIGGMGSIWGNEEIGKGEKIIPNQQGRFTPNLLVCDDMLNDGVITSIKQNKDYIPPNEPDSIVGFSRGKYSGINDKGTNSRYYDLDKWFDKIIDEIR